LGFMTFAAHMLARTDDMPTQSIHEQFLYRQSISDHEKMFGIDCMVSLSHLSQTPSKITIANPGYSSLFSLLLGPRRPCHVPWYDNPSLVRATDVEVETKRK
jgi:hypothetical protein